MPDEPPPLDLPAPEQTSNLMEPPTKQAFIMSGRVVVLDPAVGSWLYGGGRYFGQPTGIHKPKSDIFTKPLELSYLEAKYLLQRGMIEVIDWKKQKTLSKEELTALASHEYDDFESKYAIYEDLRDKGYVVRPGLKFGADFGVYKHGPGKDHSLFLVQVMTQNSSISAMQIVLAGRLATTVRKRFVIANPTAHSYYVFQWTKM